MPQKAEQFLPSRLARFSSVALTALALYMTLLAAWLPATLAVAGALLIWSSNTLAPAGQSVLRTFLNRLLLLAVILAAVLGLWLGPLSLSHWLYALPLIAFGLLPRGWATLTTVLIMAAAIAANQALTGDPTRHQLISSLLLTVALSGVLIFLREYKARQLAPLRRTDELTRAASREYLSADLHKEIQRSEREGIDMAVVMLGLDAHLSDTAADADIRSILPRIGRFLHSRLRDFDTYYRLADLQFLIILPGVATAEARHTADSLRQGLKSLLQSHHLALTVSAGVAGLNVGDDADSLHRAAANALRQAQQQGGDRVQSYSSWALGAAPAPHSGGTTP
ncbi:GGDEF domain-containing protein [Marinobacter sp. X15-166B]|uniref:GGDEF domain-containing protein n=1 Tax=Marinobacter sp. X15-166B TaxID=1897620 RepID=UPI00085CC2CF|nr:GGDEF domain-containing protein [Marinobacter sp. X15-166B]OEY66725.1 diguanylate cyclase [Marinobacter sp. X15-166B]